MKDKKINQYDIEANLFVVTALAVGDFTEMNNLVATSRYYEPITELNC